MHQTRIKWIIGAGSVALIGLFFGLFFLLQTAVTATLPPQICIPQYAADTVCYAKPQLLTRRKPTAIAISRLGNLLAVGDESTIKLWNLATRKIFYRLQGHQDLITAIAISPDEQTLASSSLDGTIKLWSLQTGSLLTTFESGRASILAFSPDSRTLASASRVRKWADGAESPTGIQFWDVVTRQRSFHLGDRPIRAIAFSPDGQLLATGSTKTQVWHIREGELLYVLDSGEVTGLVFGQDGQTLLSGSSRIKLWDLATGNLLSTLETGASDLSLSSDGQVLAIAVGGTLNFWALQPEEFIGLLRGSWFSSLFVDFALQGDAIVAGSSDGIRIWYSVKN